MTLAFPDTALEKMQADRTARARAALTSGKMKVFHHCDDSWSVKSKAKVYAVTQDMDGDLWHCTCPDFTKRCPPSVGSIPAIIFNKVDLPEPLTPIKPTFSFGSMLQLAS